MKALATVAVLVLTISQLSLPAQGIINGGFELYDPTTKFLVGWHVRFLSGTGSLGTVVDGVAGSLVPFEVEMPERFFATILGKEADPGGLPIDNYYLFARGLGASSIVAEQTVQVPSDAKSLQYRAFNGSLDGVTVELDSVRLAPTVKAIITPGGFHGKVSDWWVDVSAYAGREVHLLFALGVPGVGIDEARFSTEPIPEPSPLVLTALGLFGIGLLARNKFGTC